MKRGLAVVNDMKVDASALFAKDLLALCQFTEDKVQERLNLLNELPLAMGGDARHMLVQNPQLFMSINRQAVKSSVRLLLKIGIASKDLASLFVSFPHLAISSESLEAQAKALTSYFSSKDLATMIMEWTKLLSPQLTADEITGRMEVVEALFGKDRAAKEVVAYGGSFFSRPFNLIRARLMYLKHLKVNTAKITLQQIIKARDDVFVTEMCGQKSTEEFRSFAKKLLASPSKAR
eukprot:m.22796 g.22796  ORF g.22796 m.22796 type:complete len:235 (+) comp9284_c0_seq2:3-707(+)